MARLKFLNLFEYEWTPRREIEQRGTFNLNQFQKWVDTFGGSGTASGEGVTEENSIKFTGVLSAVSLRSDLVASSPKEILKITPEGREQDPDDDLYRLLAYEPNPYMNAYTFWELNHNRLDLWGNAYNFISHSGKKPVGLTPIEPDKIKPLVKDGKLIYRIEGTGDRVLDGDHRPSKILHFKDFTLDGVLGKSRILQAKEAIGLGKAAEKFGAEFFGNGSQARGVLEHPGTMGDDAYNNFKKSWSERDHHSTPILEEGMTYKQITIPPEAAQFIASREFQLQDIARVFRVPPHLLADLSRATFSNIEHSDIQFVKYTLRPLVKRYEHELELKLLGGDLGKKNIRFNLDGILRGDTAARAQYFAAMKQNEILTTNEIRGIEGWNPHPDGDKLQNPATSSGRNEE